jgi:ATP-binding cassette subfamily F protein 3
MVPPAMLHIDDLTYRIAGRVIFENATAAIAPGHRVGLVGRNGTGKSTLLKLILGELQADGGEINIPPRARIGCVAQEAPGGDITPLDAVLAADTERHSLLAEAETATDPHRIADIQTRLADLGAHAAPARAATILHGLGFDTAAQGRPLSSFSGGWRMRVALAGVLFAEPDLLLLDEPTNHLDLEAALWLEGHLKAYPHTMILVSHDRDLLNTAVEQILHVEHCKLTLYTGGYDRFEETRRQRLALQEAARRKQDEQRRHMQAFVDRFRYKASKARQAQSRLKALAKLQPIAAVVEGAMPEFSFPEPVQLAPPLISLDRVSVGYQPGQPILRNLDLRLDPDDRVALIGANGNGKTTLARLLAGRLQPQGGEIARAGRIAVGFFAQHQVDDLDPGATAYQYLQRLMVNARVDRVRAYLGRFGFSGERADVAAAQLSGGEKARLTLAQIGVGAPQLLILDEPTNHLDIDAREALVHALNEYAGAVVLVSHDAHLVELVADRLWLVADGTAKPFDGDVDDYRKLLLETSVRDDKSAKRETALGAESAMDRRAERRSAAKRRSELAPLRIASKEAERRIAKVQAELDQLDRALADPAEAARIPALMKQRGQVERALATAEADWIAAAEALEVAEKERA